MRLSGTELPPGVFDLMPMSPSLASDSVRIAFAESAGRMMFSIAPKAPKALSESDQRTIACQIISAGVDHPRLTVEQACYLAATYLDKYHGHQINGHFPALRDFIMQKDENE